MARATDKARTVLIADDDEFVREHLATLLRGQGVVVVEAEDGSSAIEALSDTLDLAIVDLDMPGATGLEVLAVASSRCAGVPVIMLSGAGEVEDAVTALKRGAFDYITKPFDAEELLARVREGLRVAGLEAENVTLKAGRSDTPERVPLVAESDVSRALIAKAEKCAGVDSTVLITGPSGTGKSVLARYIHQHSARSGEAFVSVNCGALPRELIESELFGHEKGAFTGADAARTGRFEAASDGTLFLDEIGELPLELQPKLLSAIQDRLVTRLGASVETAVDVRIIAATNKDLEAAVSERTFREDLYYRLNVLSLELPSLAARPDDILPLARHTVGRIAGRLGMATPELSDGACEALRGHRWPGNVRELENMLERALVFAGSGRIEAEDLGTLATARGTLSAGDLAGKTLAELEKEAILVALEAFGGNRSEAAHRLGVSERTIYNRLKEYGREPDEG